MAPEQFYRPPNTGPFSNRSEAYEGSLTARLDISGGPLFVAGPPGIEEAIEKTELPAREWQPNVDYAS